MIQVKLMAVAFLSGNQFRKLFWDITAGFVGYWAVYRNIDRVYSLSREPHGTLIWAHDGFLG